MAMLLPTQIRGPPPKGMYPNRLRLRRCSASKRLGSKRSASRIVSSSLCSASKLTGPSPITSVISERIRSMYSGWRPSR